MKKGLIVRLKRKYEYYCRRVYSYFLGKSIGAGNLSIPWSANIIGLEHIKIGENFFAGECLRLEAVAEHNGVKYAPQIIIKDNVAVIDYVHIGASNYVEIGNNVLMASKIYITDHNHGIYKGENQTGPDTPPSKRILDNDKSVIIGDNVWIGEFVSVLPGVKIGTGSIIGANSVVTKDIPAYCIAAGNPARVIKKYDESAKSWVNAG